MVINKQFRRSDEIVWYLRKLLQTQVPLKIMWAVNEQVVQFCPYFGIVNLCLLLIVTFVESGNSLLELYANSADLIQTPRYAAFDRVGTICLQVFLICKVQCNLNSHQILKK